MRIMIACVAALALAGAACAGDDDHIGETIVQSDNTDRYNIIVFTDQITQVQIACLTRDHRVLLDTCEVVRK